MEGNFADTITNSGTIAGSGAIPDPSGTVFRQDGTPDPAGSARFIRGDGSAIQMGEGNDTLTNSGAIASSNGRAINLEGGDDTLIVEGGSASITGNISGDVGTNTLTIKPGTGNSFSYAGQISNFSTVTVESGSVLFSGVNNYGGETRVTGGALVVEDTGTIGSGNVTVASGAILDISGISAATYSLDAAQTLTVGGTIDATGKTLIANGQVNPGASPGLMTVTGSFTLADTAQLNIEVAGLDRGISYDALNVSGLFTLAGTIGVTSSYTFGFGDTLDFFDFGTLDASGFNANTDLSLPSLSTGLSWDRSNVTTNGTVTVAPEPSTCGLLAGGFGLLLAARRRIR